MTDVFGGIFVSNCEPFKTGTVVAHTAITSNPVPYLGRLRGKGETAASIDTDAEILALMNNIVLIDYAATGASDSGELYTVKVTMSADTSAFMIVEGNAAKKTLDVVVDPDAYRFDRS